MRVIRQYEERRLSLLEVQQALEMKAAVLEGASSDLMAKLRGVDADLEFIQFAMRQEEQRMAAMVILRKLAQVLAEEGAN